MWDSEIASKFPLDIGKKSAIILRVVDFAVAMGVGT
jgi:hypothetical protein